MIVFAKLLLCGTMCSVLLFRNDLTCDKITGSTLLILRPNIVSPSYWHFIAIVNIFFFN